MVKKSLLMSLVVLVAGTFFGQKLMANQTTELAKQNLNVLILNEPRIEEFTVTCYCSFVSKGNGENTVYDCGTCNEVTCKGYSDSRECTRKV